MGGDASLGLKPTCVNELTPTGLLVGGALALGGVLGGVALAFQQDHANVEVVAGSGSSRLSAQGPLDGLAGARVRGRF